MSPYHIKESEVYVFPTVSFLATTIELPRLKKIYKHSPAEDYKKKKKQCIVILLSTSKNCQLIQYLKIMVAKSLNSEKTRKVHPETIK